MNHRILYSLLFVLLSSPVFGQFYTGVNNMTIITKGSSVTTEVSSDQMVARYIPQQTRLTFMVKTQALSLKADKNGKKFVMESLLAQSNPLLSIALLFDINNLDGETVKGVKGMLLFNDGRMNFTTDIKIVKTEKSFTVSMELDLDLDEIGIYAPDQSKTFSSSKVQFIIKDAELNLR